MDYAGGYGAAWGYGFGYATFPTGDLRGDEGLVDQPRQLPHAISHLLGD